MSFAMRGLVFGVVTLIIVCSANAEVLVFSDNFTNDDFDERWTYSSEDLISENGRVVATDNGRFLRTIQEFGSELRRIEVDIEKGGDRNHACWDYFVTLVEAPNRQVSNARAALLFDQDAIDAVGIDTQEDVCLNSTDFVSVNESATNKGTLSVSIGDSQMQYSFTNSDGDVLNAPPTDLDDFDSVGVRIHVAAFADSPRYVDAVRIYAVPEPSTITLLSCSLLGFFAMARRRPVGNHA